MPSWSLFLYLLHLTVGFFFLQCNFSNWIWCKFYLKIFARGLCIRSHNFVCHPLLRITFLALILWWRYVRIYFGYLFMNGIAESYGILLRKLPKMIVSIHTPSTVWYSGHTTSLSTFKLVSLYHLAFLMCSSISLWL